MGVVWKIGTNLSSGHGIIAFVANSISQLFIFLMMLLITADVIGRYVFNSPVPGTYNISESMMVFIVFLAFASTQAKRQNIRIEIVTRRLSPRKRYPLDLIISLAGILFFGLICWQTWPLAIESWSMREYMSGPVSLPLYPSKLCLPIGSFLLVVQFLIDLVTTIGKGPTEVKGKK